MTIDKTAAEAYSKAGDVVHYTITVDNTSSNDSPDLVCTVTDPLLGIVQPVTLAWNAPNYVINATYTVQPGDPDPLVNTATVTCSPVGFPNVLTASAGASVDLVHPAFTLNKTLRPSQSWPVRMRLSTWSSPTQATWIWSSCSTRT